MDSFVFYGPGGASPVQLGSWVRADPGPDFDTAALLKAALIEAPFNEGALAWESSGVRRMRFPLIVGSAADAGGLTNTESLLRRNARPSAFIDLQPEGIPSSEAVRFDVLAGRWKPDYSIFHQRISRRLGWLELDVKPYGYWPTWITLASVASVGLPGTLAVPGASVIGDAPGLGRIVVQPTVATQYPAGSWAADMVAWTLGHTPSIVAFWPAASLGSAMVASLTGDLFAPASQAWSVFPNPSQAGYAQLLVATIPTALTGAYSGRLRVFAHAQLTPSTFPWRLAVDAAALPAAALASSGAVATLPPALAPATWLPNATPAYHIVDLGEISYPAAPAGLPHAGLIRLWAAPATSPGGLATPLLKIAALHLMAADTAGVAARGLAQPSISPAAAAPTSGRITVDTDSRSLVVGAAAPNLATSIPLGDALQHLVGGFPYVTPSVNRIDLLTGSRRYMATRGGGPSYPIVVASDAPKAWFRFEETAGPTWIDSRGSWHGSYTLAPYLAGSGAVDRGARFGAASQLALVPSILGPVATSWTIEMWLGRYGGSIGRDILFQGDEAGAGNLLYIKAQPTVNGLMIFGLDGDGGSGDVQVASAFPGDTDHHHFAFTWTYSTRTMAVWRDAALLASGVVVSTYKASGPIAVGANLDAGPERNLRGLVDELAFYHGTALGSGIIASHYAAASLLQIPSGLEHQLVRTAPYFAAASLQYRPRFQFLKGL